jgi:hypothetical protein
MHRILVTLVTVEISNMVTILDSRQSTSSGCVGRAGGTAARSGRAAGGGAAAGSPKPTAKGGEAADVGVGRAWCCGGEAGGCGAAGETGTGDRGDVGHAGRDWGDGGSGRDGSSFSVTSKSSTGGGREDDCPSGICCKNGRGDGGELRRGER